MRGPWWVAMVLGAAAAPRPGEVRVRSLVLVDAEGHEVGRLASTPGGAELVLGGGSQASLVTDQGVAALNLVGDQTWVRRVEDPAD